jgi:hypothetical protein
VAGLLRRLARAVICAEPRVGGSPERLGSGGLRVSVKRFLGRRHEYRGNDIGRGREQADHQRLAGADAAIQSELDPLPEAADFVGRFA